VEDSDGGGLGSLLGHIGIGHPRKPLSSTAKRVCLTVRGNLFHKTLFYLLKRSFGFIMCKPNAWHLNYNNFYFNFNIMVLYAYVLCLCILASLRILRYDLGRQTPHS
jgi:hypothetical protein